MACMKSSDPRTTRDLHFLNEDGNVACNPRDKEAAHRAQVEGIAVEEREKVTCRKCMEIMHRLSRRLFSAR